MPTSVHPLRASITSALASGDVDQALRLSGQLAAERPRDFDALVLHAEMLERAGRGIEAIGFYDRAGTLLPGHALPFTRAGVLRFRARFGSAPHARPASPDQDGVSMRNLGCNGRFGNQLLQYAFLRLYAERHGLRCEAPDWIGRDLFDLDDPHPRGTWPTAREGEVDLMREFASTGATLRNRDIDGYFCGHSAAWRPHQRRFRELFTPGCKVAPLLAEAMSKIRRHGSTLVAIHVRRTDFGYGRFWVAPTEWYLRWLEGIWQGLDRPILYVASDDPEVVRDFDRFPVLTPERLDVKIPGAEFLLDHHVLRMADRLAISNSTFSFTAAMLNDRCSTPMRPDPNRRSLVTFDPWDSEVMVQARDDGSLGADARDLVARSLPPRGLVIHVGEFCSAWTNFARTVHPHLNILETSATDVDRIRGHRGLTQVQALVVERPDQLAAVLAGSERSLRHARIDAVHFRAVGGEPAGAAIGPLLQADFSVFRVNGPSALAEVGPSDTLEAGQHFALSNRLRPLFFGRRTTGLDLVGLLAHHGLQIHGVLHVGAHEGQEISTYDRLGVRNVTFVEANPEVHARLCKAMAGREHVRCVHRAISDAHGTVRLNLASFDQSSSILPMAGHLEIYPEIVPAGSVEVPCTTIDGLIAECGGSFDMFDLLHLDIQGAEGLALRGARQALQHIDAVHVEVNFSNLYERGAQIEEIEDLLRTAGFRRVALLCPFHPSWGDALYVRTAADLA